MYYVCNIKTNHHFGIHILKTFRFSRVLIIATYIIENLSSRDGNKVTGLLVHVRITVNGKEQRFNGVRLFYSMKLVSNKSISEFRYVTPMLSSPTPVSDDKDLLLSI